MNDWMDGMYLEAVHIKMRSVRSTDSDFCPQYRRWAGGLRVCARHQLKLFFTPRVRCFAVQLPLEKKNDSQGPLSSYQGTAYNNMFASSIIYASIARLITLMAVQKIHLTSSLIS